MTTRCKVGDLAIIVNAYHPSNLGLIVRVVGAHDGVVPGIGRLEVTGPYWLVEGIRPMIYSNYRKRIETKVGPAPDSALEPIRGRCSDRQAAQMATQLLKKVRSLPDPVTVNARGTWTDYGYRQYSKEIIMDSMNLQHLLVART